MWPLHVKCGFLSTTSYARKDCVWEEKESMLIWYDHVEAFMNSSGFVGVDIDGKGNFMKRENMHCTTH